MKKNLFAAVVIAFASLSAQAAGLVDTLKGLGPFTFFAPTDAAFGQIFKADLDKLLAAKTKLKSVLTRPQAMVRFTPLHGADAQAMLTAAYVSQARS